jgi:hypothetical protein
MKPIRKLSAVTAAALVFTAGSAFAQAVETPYSPNESGLADLPGSETASTIPTTPTTSAVPTVPGQGATLAPETGRTVRIDRERADNLPMTPDSDPEYNRNGD